MYYCFNNTVPPEIYTLSLHDALPIFQKYQGMEGHAPKLDTLGGTAWVKVKKRVKAELRSMATELLQLYAQRRDRKSTRLNSSHMSISYAVFCLKKKKNNTITYLICVS